MSAELPLPPSLAPPRVSTARHAHPIRSPLERPIARSTAVAAASPIRISVERLRLVGTGLAAMQRAHLRMAVEYELSRLLQARPATIDISDRDVVQGLGLSGGKRGRPNPEALGADIARSLLTVLLERTETSA